MTSKNESNKPDCGYLFPHEKTTERSPDFRGKVTAGGKEYWVSGWKKPKDGQDMITVSLTPMRSGEEVRS